MKKPYTIFLALLTLLLLAGCDERANPKPRDTILGNKRYTQSRPDWIDENFAYGDEGLTPRQKSHSSDKSSKALRQKVAQVVKAAQTKSAEKNSQDAVYFDFDNSSIKAEERTKLAEAAQKLKNDPKSELLVVGRCDFHGTQEYNLSLGDRRARSVNNYLIQLGVPKDQIKTLSKGSLDATPNANDQVAAHDRRSDLVLTN